MSVTSRKRTPSQAVEEYRLAIAAHADNKDWEWAELQGLLCRALRAQALEATGDEASQLFRQAIEAHREGCTVWVTDGYPTEEALDMGNIGRTFRRQARAVAGDHAVQLLGRAAEAYRRDFSMMRREEFPLEWALIQTRLGDTLHLQAEAAAGADTLRLFREAIDAYRQALTVYTREECPDEWAACQDSLGETYCRQASCEENDDAARARLLEKALEACHEALLVFTPETHPWSRATTQRHIGDIFRDRAALAEEPVVLGWCEDEETMEEALQEVAQLLDEAAEAYRKALTVHTLEKYPDEWAEAKQRLDQVLRFPIISFVAHIFAEGGGVDCDADWWPENLAAMDAVALVEKIAERAEYDSCTVNVAEGEEGINLLWAKMSEAAHRVDQSTLDTAMQAFELTADVAVVDGNGFAPRLMPNGSLVIRNFHRVLLISDRIQQELVIDSNSLRGEVAELARTSDHAKVLRVVHRGLGGEVHIGCAVPETLSAVGQSLIFVHSSADLAKAATLAKSSLTGMGGWVMIRVFGDRCYFHALDRGPDDLDTLVEEYGVRRSTNESTGGDDCEFDVVVGDAAMREWFRCRSREIFESYGLKLFPDDSPMHSPILTMINAYADEKRSQLTFTPFFGPDSDKPVFHVERTHFKYWDISVAYQHRIAVVEFSVGGSEQMILASSTLASEIDHLFTPMKPLAVTVKLITSDNDAAVAPNDLAAIDSEMATRELARRSTALQAHSGQARPGQSNAGSTLCVVLVFPTIVDVQALNTFLLMSTGERCGRAYLHVPGLGLMQAYDCGNHLDGNGGGFILKGPEKPAPRKLADEEDEDEDDYEDDDYEDG
jgi:tetratricopeptide (TPR) repeat protein